MKLFMEFLLHARPASRRMRLPVSCLLLVLSVLPDDRSNGLQKSFFYCPILKLGSI